MLGFTFSGAANPGDGWDTIWPASWVVLANPERAPGEEGQGASYPSCGFSRLYLFSVPLFFPLPCYFLSAVPPVQRAGGAVSEGR